MVQGCFSLACAANATLTGGEHMNELRSDTSHGIKMYGCRCNLLMDLNDHLSKVSPALQKLEGLLGLIKRKHSIDNRVDLMLLVEFHHLFESVSRAVDDPLQSESLAQSQKIDIRLIASGASFAGSISNAIYKTAVRSTLETLENGLGTTSL